MDDKTITSPIRAIRAKCLDCSGTSNEVRLCSIESCSLHPFRFGKNPFRTVRTMTEEQRQAALERLAAWRKSKGDEQEEEEPMDD